VESERDLLGSMSPETRQSVAARVSDILREVEGEIAARKPVCLASGRCCKFETYGHRLYVTTAELVHFAERLEVGTVKKEGVARRIRLPVLAGIASAERMARVSTEIDEQIEHPGDGCPYQIEGLCTARDARPLGCPCLTFTPQFVP